MPCLQEFVPSDGIRVGIWHITETDVELRLLVNLTDSETKRYNSFHQYLRKRQWLACRALLSHMLLPGSPAVLYDPYGKPYLVSGSHNISVTHAGDFAAAVCSKKKLVGIDVEMLKERVEGVKERFMSSTEIESLDHEKRLEHLYVYWCGKEALYKLNGKPELDFKKDIYIHPFDYFCNMDKTCRATLTVDGSRSDYTLWYRKMEDYMMVVAF